VSPVLQNRVDQGGMSAHFMRETYIFRERNLWKEIICVRKEIQGLFPYRIIRGRSSVSFPSEASHEKNGGDSLGGAFVVRGEVGVPGRPARALGDIILNRRFFQRLSCFGGCPTGATLSTAGGPPLGEGGGCVPLSWV